jgi:hypothetical protein
MKQLLINLEVDQRVTDDQICAALEEHECSKAAVVPSDIGACADETHTNRYSSSEVAQETLYPSSSGTSRINLPVLRLVKLNTLTVHGPSAHEATGVPPTVIYWPAYGNETSTYISLCLVSPRIYLPVLAQKRTPRRNLHQVLENSYAVIPMAGSLFQFTNHPIRSRGLSPTVTIHS